MEKVASDELTKEEFDQAYLENLERSDYESGLLSGECGPGPGDSER